MLWLKPWKVQPLTKHHWIGLRLREIQAVHKNDSPRGIWEISEKGLVYHLLIAIERTLRDNRVHDSWTAVRDVLSSRQAVTVVLPTADNGTLLGSAKARHPNLSI
jgi:hypothetical protein